MLRAPKYWMIVPAVVMLLAAACGRSPEADHVTVTVDKGTELRVKPLTALSPATEEPGAEFTATLEAPLMGRDQVAVPEGATIVGQVVESSGMPADASQSAPFLTLKLKEIVVPGGESISIDTEPVRYTPAGMTASTGQEPQAQSEANEPAEPPAASSSMGDDGVLTFHLADEADIPVTTDQGAPKPVS